MDLSPGRRGRPQDERPPDAVVVPRGDGRYHDQDIRQFVAHLRGDGDESGPLGEVVPSEEAHPGPEVPEG